jgi:hypothetical protein
MRLSACVILGHMEYRETEVEEFQETLLNEFIVKITEKYADDEDLADEKIKKYNDLGNF